MLEPMPKKPRIYEIKDLKSVIYTFWNKRFHFVKNTSRTISFFHLGPHLTFFQGIHLLPFYSFQPLC